MTNAYVYTTITPAMTMAKPHGSNVRWNAWNVYLYKKYSSNI